MVSYAIHVLVAILEMKVFSENPFLVSQFYGTCYHLLTLTILSST